MICQFKNYATRFAPQVLAVLGGLMVHFLQPAALAASPTPPPTQSVTFAWDPSDDPTVAGYNIYYGTASHAYPSKVSVGSATTATISGLTEGVTYFFAATTYAAEGTESEFSEEITYTVPVAVPNEPPTIIGMQAAGAAVAGQNVTFSITATGTGPLRYQWVHDAATIATATNSVLTLNRVTSAEAGAYYVTVSNDTGSTNRAVASLAVYSTPAATLSPAAPVNGQFAVNISGVPDFQYVVEASTNLVDWIPMQTNAAPFVFLDSAAVGFSQRYYRAYYLP